MAKKGRNKVKIISCLVAIVLSFGVLCTMTDLARAADSRGSTSNVSDSILDDTLQGLTDSGATVPMDEIYREIFGQRVSWRDVVDQVLSGRGLDLKMLWNAVSGSIAGEIGAQVKVLGKIMLLGLVIACLKILSETISPEGASKIALWACHVALIVLAVFAFRDVFTIANSTVESLRSALFAFVPCLTGLLLTQGATASAGVLYPVVFGVGSWVSIFLLDVAFPLIYTALALELAGNLVGSDRVSGVCEILRQFAFIGTGLLTASFVGVVVSQRAAAGVADGVALRTAKYVTSTFVPVAGKMVGDTMDMFFQAVRALRTAVGLAGCLAVLAVVFNPLLKLISCLFAWKLSFALLGPITGRDVSRSMKSMADGITALTMSIFVASFAFIICLSLMAAAVRI